MRRFLSALVFLTVSVALAAQIIFRAVPRDSSRPEIFIIGDHHLVGINTTDSITGICTLADSCRTLFVEVDPNPHPEEVERLLTPSPDSICAALLTPLQTDTLFAAADAWGMSHRLISGLIHCFGPETVVSYLSMLRFEALVPDEASATGLTDGLYARMRPRNVAVIPFETHAFQAAILDNYCGIETLMYLVRDPAAADAQVLLVYRAYLDGDLATITDLADDDLLPGQAEAVIYARNAAWAERLLRADFQGPALVAVGCAHLGGDRGLLALLAPYYQIIPLKPSVSSSK